MSDIFEVIKNRRSVRAYKDEQIEDEQIEQILEELEKEEQDA